MAKRDDQPRDSNLARQAARGHQGVTRFSGKAGAQPPALRWFNRLGYPFRRLVSLSPKRLTQAARERAGVDDSIEVEFGDAFEALLESVRFESDLHLAGRIAAYQDSLRLLITQLRMSETFKREPEIAQTVLPPPIFVTGMPRTGTSLLLNLLCQDPDHRALEYWEGFDPVPRRGGREDQTRRTANMLRGLEYTSPGYQSIHPMEADNPEECVMLFMHTFTTPQFDIQYEVPSYMQWLNTIDRRPSYRHYRRQLQLLQHRRPAGKRMVLKDPSHLLALDVILDVFPDARIVHIHRDPVTAVASNCSLYAHTRAIFMRGIEPERLGDHVLNGIWPSALQRATELRAALPPERVIDVAYADLMREPLGTMVRLYEQLGLELSDEVRARLEAWLKDNPQDKHGVHAYSLAQYGLERSQVEERFADYRRLFDVEYE